ncbi:hypothetical protein JCM6882_003087 [Rhodosporidiobolus microsporus]
MSGQGLSSSTGKQRAPSKRATLSCSECRRLKLKCDRQVPCSSCVKRGLSHLCPDGALVPTRTSKLAASATALAERVELLEDLLRQNGLGHTVPPLPEAANLGIDMMAKRREAAKEGGGGAAFPAEGTSSRAQKPEEVEVELLQMGVGSLTVRDDGSYRYLGPSAGMAFRGEASSFFIPLAPLSPAHELHLQSTDDKPLPGPASETANDDSANPHSEPLDLPASFPFLAVQTTIEDIQEALPPKEEAIRVSKLYWDNCTFVFCPITHDDYWDDYLENAYSLEPNGPKVACVCMVLALGVQFDPDVPPAASTIFERYFDLGQAALAVSRFLSHIAVIQALHLTGNVLLNRPKWRENGENFFPLFGVAIKGAQTMGLHRDPSAWGLDEAEVHRRRLAFWELLSLDRLSAFLSGRPYTLHAGHFDTAMPDGIPESTKEKYRLVLFMGEAIDALWSVKMPSYALINSMDQKLRRQYMDSPMVARCRALPPFAFSTPGAIPPAPPEQYDGEEVSFKVQCEQHTYAIVYAAILFYMHKGPFAQALDRYSDEPLKSPWAPSVRIIVLEATAYILKIAQSWMSLDPVLHPRWWNISLHLFVAGVSMSSFIVRSPSSMLTSHAWDQLNEACSIFESAAQSGTAAAATLPRILSLRQKAHDAITAARRIPSGPADRLTVKQEEPDSTASDLLSFGTTTVLSRGGKSTSSASANTSAAALGPSGPSTSVAGSGRSAAVPPPPSNPSASAAPAPPSFAPPASYLHLLAAAHNRSAPTSDQFSLPSPAAVAYEPYTQHLPYPPPPPPASALQHTYTSYTQQPPQEPFYSPFPPTSSSSSSLPYTPQHPTYLPAPISYLPDAPARYNGYGTLPTPPPVGNRGAPPTSGTSGGWGAASAAGGEGSVQGGPLNGSVSSQGGAPTAAQDWACRRAPRLSSDAAQKLSSHFVALRKQVQQVERDNNERSSIPITVRQLEAIIRISESLAKVELKTEVLDTHVDEAIRLFKFSTMDAVRAGNIDGMTKGELMEEIEAIEKDLRQRNKLGTGRTMPYSSLRNHYVQQRGFTQHAFDRCLMILERSDVIQFLQQRRMVRRMALEEPSPTARHGSRKARVESTSD